MSRSNVDGMLNCVTDSETQDIESEEVEASPACIGPKAARAESKLTWDESEVSSAQIKLEAANTESETTWQEIEDEWFEFGSDFLIF